jgi:hypothetical protein
MSSSVGRPVKVVRGVVDIMSASSWPVGGLHAREAAGLIGVEAENITDEPLGPTVEIRYSDGTGCRLREDDRSEFNWLTPQDYDTDEPGVRRHSAGGSMSNTGAYSSSRFWAWPPLPPEGPIVVRFVWPEFEIDSIAELDGSVVRLAAVTEIDLWPKIESN